MLRGVRDSVRVGPNWMHAAILHSHDPQKVAELETWMREAKPPTRRDRILRRVDLSGLPNDVEHLGWSHNVMTTANNGGRDMLAGGWGGAAGFGVSGTIATASSATTLTATSTPFVASAYIGQIVVAEETTNAPVWGVIVSNTTSVLTIDGWKNGDGTAGTTPGSTANYLILPGTAPYRYMALTTDSSAASASSTSLTSEITTNGGGRALATYAHTLGASTFTLSKTFTITGTLTAIHRVGLFQLSTASSAVLGFEVVLNADATVVNGDSLAVTYTGTLS